MQRHENEYAEKIREERERDHLRLAGQVGRQVEIDLSHRNWQAATDHLFDGIARLNAAQSGLSQQTSLASVLGRNPGNAVFRLVNALDRHDVVTFEDLLRKDKQFLGALPDVGEETWVEFLQLVVKRLPEKEEE